MDLWTDLLTPLVTELNGTAAFVAPVHSLIELLDGYLIVRRIRLPEGVDPDGITAAA